MSTELVRIRYRPSRDGKSFVYMLDYRNEQGKRSRVSLGHADKKKAERQRAQKERELKMGIVEPESMTLVNFTKDSLERTGRQIRESTRHEYKAAMSDLVDVIGAIDFKRVTLKHGETFRQACLDKGNSPATVGKKLRHIKRIFQLAVDRKQLDENPMKRIRAPKTPKKKVEMYKPDECERILRVARERRDTEAVNWELLILVALTTGMRRGEILNATWKDIDFAAKTIEVSPKHNTEHTWEWFVKDTDRRTLPLTDEVLDMLAKHQAAQQEGNPYAFVPMERYERIQELRARGNWTLSDSRLKVINNFGRQFKKMLRMANVRQLEFHDLRNTALTNWLANGMSEFDVMRLAGHASFATTHTFYLAVSDDLVDRARTAAEKSINLNLARTWHALDFAKERD